MIALRQIERLAIVPVMVILLFVPSLAQKKHKHHKAAHDMSGRPVLFESHDISRQDLYLGPGGEAMMPDLSHITLIKEEKGGYSRKFRIRDGAGRVWVAKVSNEAQPETAAVRLLAAIGYRTEINYLVPRLAIPGAGVFNNVRLEARPEDVHREGIWRWGSSPFEGTHEM